MCAHNQEGTPIHSDGTHQYLVEFDSLELLRKQ
jgi:hypothetical protein